MAPDEWDHVSPRGPHVLFHWAEGGQEDLCAVSQLVGEVGDSQNGSPLLGEVGGLPGAPLAQAGLQILGRVMKSPFIP